jgi:serine/threonine protein kinase
LTFKEKVGKGGFGTVYRGLWHGSQCAVKVIKCDDSDNGQDDAKREVLEEAEVHG